MIDETDPESVERKRLELMAKCSEVLGRKWAEEKSAEEPMFRYVVEFECTPSTFEQIQRYIATQRTFKRFFRYYTIAKKNKGTVIKQWQNRT